ncbi:STAS domain-containing protein [Streptomyces sp. NPDC048489]|uniref:STAS domain-containing protein n=1 Tax=Streptomyces sp. NPDC048489 TaxID=3154504 RepID=UPI0034220601
MLFTLSGDGVSAVITPQGEIDFITSPSLHAFLQQLPPSVTGVTWDLRQTRFMDVAGLHLLVHLRQACQDAGRTLTVTGADEPLRRLLQLAHDLFPAGHWDDFLPGGLLTATG